MMMNIERRKFLFQGKMPLPILFGILINLLTLSNSFAEASQNTKLFFLGNKNIAPVVYMDNTTPSGVAVDIVHALAKHIPQPIEIKAMDWLEAQALVARGEADALIQINQTEERKKIYDFSDTLLESQFSIFTSTNRVGISGISSLCGLRVGVESGGLPRQLLEKHPRILLTIIPDFLEGFKLLNENTIDAVVVDYRVGSYILAENKLQNIKVTGKPIAFSYSSIAVKKGNTKLLNAINNALRIIKADGAYQNIIDKWKPKEVVFQTREQITQRIYSATILILLILFLIAVIWMVTLKKELTKRKAAEEKLREQYSTLRSIINSANALVFSVDRQYLYTCFNKGHAVVMQAIYGVEIKIGHCLLDYMTVTADREIAKRNVDRALAGEQFMEEAYSGEELRTRKYFHVSHSPIKTESGDVIGVAVLAQDMTERKRAEEALRAKQQRLSDMTVELSLAEERERRRIAAELHDNIGQDLVLARIKLGMLAKMPLTDEEAGILDNTREILGGMIQRVRFLTHMISPPILESCGLEAALKWLGRQMETDYSLRVSFVDDSSEKPLTEEMRSVLYHAVRELLINVAKHAETDTARVAVGREGGRIAIRVEDDGVGFDPDAVEESLTRKEGGFGLFNIRRRIIHLGGAFEVESSPGAGTRVTIGLPLERVKDEIS